MKFEDITVGVKLRHVSNSIYRGMVGTVREIIGKFFYIHAADGQEIGIGWSNAVEWEKFVESRPMLAGDKRVNTRVVCVYNADQTGSYGMCGRISEVGADGRYIVIDDNGNYLANATYWGEMSSFEVVLDSVVGSRPMTKQDIQKGIRVVCTFASRDANYVGREGNIVDVIGSTFYVNDDDGNRIGHGGWGVAAWRVSLAQPIGITEVVAVAQDSVACPSYYLGANACTCGKHKHKRKFVFQ